MKPFSIALSINLAFFAIWGLFFTLVMDRPEMIPLMTSLQSAINALFATAFYVDRKPKIAMAFVWGLLLTVIVTVIGYIILNKYAHLIGVEEGYTAYILTHTQQFLAA